MNTICKTDNDLADWFSAAKRGDRAEYYSYRIASQDPLLCRAREPGSPFSLIAEKAWSLYAHEYVSLAQHRVDGVCRYLAIKR